MIGSEINSIFDSVTHKKNISISNKSKIYLGQCQISGNMYVVKNIQVSSSALNEINILKTLKSHSDSIKMSIYAGHTINNGNICIYTHYLGITQPLSNIKYLEKLNISKSHLIIGIAKYLQFLHKLNICHLDIKPSNIIVTSAYDVVIIDYELSTTCGQPISKEGTPYFMSPEFFNSENDADSALLASYELDIYALGVTIYFVLTGGHYPFEIKKSTDLNASKSISTSTLASTLTSTFNIIYNQNNKKHIPDIVYQCLESNPKLRPSLSEIIDQFV